MGKFGEPIMMVYDDLADNKKKKGIEIVSAPEGSLVDYGALKQNAEDTKAAAERLAASTYDARMSSIDNSQRKLEFKNYLAYRQLIQKYLPEYLNSSGLYDAGSMSQAFLDAKNGYINKSEDIAREYDAQRTEAGIALAQSKADAFDAYNDSIALIDEQQRTEEDERYRSIRDQLIGYLDLAAKSGEEDEWDFDALESFAETYATDLEALKEYNIEYYNTVGRALNTYLEMDSYKAAYEADQDAKAEQERVEDLQSKVVNLGNVGYTVVDGNNIKSDQGKKFEISKDGDKYSVKISQKETADDLKDAASNIENEQLFMYDGKLYVKLSDGIYSIKAADWMMEDVHFATRGGLSEKEREFLLNCIKEEYPYGYTYNQYLNSDDRDIYQYAIDRDMVDSNGNIINYKK